MRSCGLSATAELLVVCVDVFAEAGDVLIQDVFVLDALFKCYVWVGKAASRNEKKNGFAYAHVRTVRHL